MDACGLARRAACLVTPRRTGRELIALFVLGRNEAREGEGWEIRGGAEGLRWCRVWFGNGAEGSGDCSLGRTERVTSVNGRSHMHGERNLHAGTGRMPCLCLDYQQSCWGDVRLYFISVQRQLIHNGSTELSSR